MHKGQSYFRKENFSLSFFCCGDVFVFLPGGELILATCAFLFIAFLPAPNFPCIKFWEGRPRACFVRLRAAVLILSPLPVRRPLICISDRTKTNHTNRVRILNPGFSDLAHVITFYRSLYEAFSNCFPSLFQKQIKLVIVD